MAGSGPLGVPNARWKRHIVRQLRQRDRAQKALFLELVPAYNRLLEKAELLAWISEKLQPEPNDVTPTTLQGPWEEDSGPDSDEIPSPTTLRVKWQEEEEGLRRVCGEMAYQVVEKSAALGALESTLEERQSRLAALEAHVAELQEARARHARQVDAQRELNAAQRAAYEALRAHARLQEAALRRLEEEARDLLERLVQRKARAAAERNLRLERLEKAKQAQVSLELKKAAKRTVSISEKQQACPSHVRPHQPLFTVLCAGGRGAGPLTFLSFTPSPRSPHSVSQGIREEAETLAPTAEPLSLKSEAGDKWKRPFSFKKRRGHSVGGAPEQRYQSIPVCVAARPPTQVQDVLDAHLSEVNAVCFGPSSSLLATGGADRLIQLWNVVGGRLEANQTLEGAGGSITSVDFDPSVRGLSLSDMVCLLCGLPNPLSMIWEALRQPLPQLSGLRDVASVQVQVKGLRLPLPSFQGSQVLAATYNQAAQIWKVGEVQSKETLSGHTDKVTAAKFKLTRHQAVTGSRDRTVKEWDLGRAYCSRTINVLSYCNDVVCGDHVIISGHYDQKIRFWDSRVPCCTQVIPVQGRVTSLNLSYDQLHLLSCSRDDTLKVIDLRVSNIRQVFRADGFRCGSDWTKAVFSPDRSYALAGSWDGALYIWNVDTGKLEGSLRGPHCTAINAVAWCASGSHVVSVDQARKVVLWR
ncbi:protein Atg16l2 isoform X2 [Mustela putorius furo]|uniref:Protein Atg16l2 n=1 Tax=Mustela putorius furo TaxID=9669 RepID=A0A8U0UUX8_MUSPF|nr:protein Atg16l2 isoform X2 [Mustela putorius furo]